MLFSEDGIYILSIGIRAKALSEGFTSIRARWFSPRIRMRLGNIQSN
jgi:hypothetical protein